MNYGIQMYSLRDTTEKDLEAGLAAVAEFKAVDIEESTNSIHEANHADIGFLHFHGGYSSLTLS